MTPAGSGHAGKRQSQGLAVLIDAGNTGARHAHAIFEEIVKLGEANVRRIYGDFSGTHLADWNKEIQSLAILQHQQRSITTGKNTSDIALVIDAMDLMHKGKQYDVCLFPGRAEEQSPHVPRKTGNVLTAAWPIAINVMVACRPTSGTTSSLPEGIHRHLGPRPRSNAPSQSLPRTEQAPYAVPSPVDLANATCSVQTDPTAVCVPS